MSGALLFVKHLSTMTEFYRAVLGPESSSSYGVEWRCDGWSFALHPIPDEVAQTIEIETPAVPREETPIKLIFAVEDVASVRAAAVRLGGQAVERPWGAIDVIDPEGNIFALQSRS